MHKKNEHQDNPAVKKCETIDSILAACGWPSDRVQNDNRLSEALDALRFDWIKLCELNRQVDKFDPELNAAKKSVSTRIRAALDSIEVAATGLVAVQDIQSGIRDIRTFMDENTEICGGSYWR